MGRREAVIHEAPAPVGVTTSSRAEPAGVAAVAPPAVTPSSTPGRRVAPNTSEIGDCVVGVFSARLGPIDERDDRKALCLVVRVTNRSAKPITHVSWSKPEVSVVLRDRSGQTYKRILPERALDVEIKPDETISDRLVFEPVERCH